MSGERPIGIAFAAPSLWLRIVSVRKPLQSAIQTFAPVALNVANWRICDLERVRRQCLLSGNGKAYPYG